MTDPKLHLPIYVRAHTRLLDTRQKPARKPKQMPHQWAKYALVLDCETSTALGQKLNFGFYRWCKLQDDKYICLEEGILYRNDLDAKSVALLRQFAGKKPDVARGVPDVRTEMQMMNRDAFVSGPLLDIIMAGGCVVGYNLPFDIGALAHQAKPSQHGDGWSFIMFTYPSGQENKNLPRIRIIPIDSHTARISLSSGQPRDENGKPVPCRWPERYGRFLDLSHMVTAMRNAHMSLAQACREFKVPGKLDHEPTGRVTPEEIHYARQDVAATLNLLNATKREFDGFQLSIRPEKVYSAASLAKGFLKDMGLARPQVKFKNVSDHILGCAAQAYHGGRVECHIRKTSVPGVIYDVTSEYPAVAALLGIWDLLRAKDIRIEDCTQDARELLSNLTVDQLLDRPALRRLAFFAKVKLQGELLPVRAKYDGRALSTGINHPFSEHPLWFAGPHLAAAVIEGKAPEIVEAFRLVPIGIQDGLNPVKLGTRTFNPEVEDFFVELINERHRLKATDKKHPHVLLLKIIANSVYGCMSELNPRTYGKNNPQRVEIFSGDIHCIERMNKVEIPGQYNFIPAAALITAGGELMLTMAEKLIEQASGSYAMMDTDAVIVVASESGGLVPCDNGPERMPDGRAAVRALTWQQADEIFNRFDVISPFDPMVVPHLFKKEDANLRANEEQAELKYFGIGSKIYCCFRANPNAADIIKPSQLVLGNFFRPDHREWKQARDSKDDEKYPPLIFDDWRFILRRELGSGDPGDWPNPFIDKIVMRKVRVTTPRQMAKLRQLDPEKARPFSFCISPVLERYPRHEKLSLLAPSNPHSDEWKKLSYIDERTGKIYLLHDRSKEKRVNGIVQDDPKVLMPQLWGHVLLHLQNHPEAKCAGGDGIGLLGHRQIRVPGLWIIGKEIQRELVAGESFSEIEPEEPLIYSRPLKQSSANTKRSLGPMVIDRLKSKYPIKKRLARKTKLHHSVISRAFQDEPIQLRSWELLMKEYEGST